MNNFFTSIFSLSFNLFSIIPVAHTSIDIPTSPDINIQNLEYILNGISLGKFDFLEDLKLSINLETIQNLYNAYNNPTIKEITFKVDPLFTGEKEEDQEIRWREKYYIDKIEKIIEEIKDNYPKSMIETLRELNDFSALVGYLGLEKLKVTSYLDYLNKVEDELIRKEKEEDFRNIKNNYKVDSI
ncbi:unnamed protein product, partial [marine sediment metagenome]